MHFTYSVNFLFNCFYFGIGLDIRMLCAQMCIVNRTCKCRNGVTKNHQNRQNNAQNFFHLLFHNIFSLQIEYIIFLYYYAYPLQNKLHHKLCNDNRRF